MNASQAYTLAGGIISFSLAAVFIYLAIFWPNWVVSQVDFFADYGTMIRVIMFFIGIVGIAWGYLAIDELVTNYTHGKDLKDYA
jgi:hypothetical protein